MLSVSRNSFVSNNISGSNSRTARQRHMHAVKSDYNTAVMASKDSFTTKSKDNLAFGIEMQGINEFAQVGATKLLPDLNPYSKFILTCVTNQDLALKTLTDSIRNNGLLQAGNAVSKLDDRECLMGLTQLVDHPDKKGVIEMITGVKQKISSIIGTKNNVENYKLRADASDAILIKHIQISEHIKGIELQLSRFLGMAEDNNTKVRRWIQDPDNKIKSCDNFGLRYKYNFPLNKKSLLEVDPNKDITLDLQVGRQTKPLHSALLKKIDNATSYVPIRLVRTPFHKLSEKFDGFKIIDCGEMLNVTSDNVATALEILYDSCTREAITTNHRKEMEILHGSNKSIKMLCLEQPKS